MVGGMDEYVMPFVATAMVEGGGRGAERRKPREAALAIEMLAGGATYRDVSKETGLTFNELSGLKARMGATIEERRKQLAVDGLDMAEKLRLLVQRKAEMLAEDEGALAKVSMKDLVISYAVGVDKGMQALGENKVVVEHRGGKPTLEDAMKAIREARESLQKEAIEV
jgi:hypothetical protein